MFVGSYVIETCKTVVLDDKPIYVGTSVLDLIKLCMLDFHYTAIHKDLENQSKVT